MTAIPPEVAAEIDAAVRLGFEPMFELTNRICELLGVDGADTDAIDAVGMPIFAALDEQESWARPTDAERLVGVFDQLSGLGIIARQWFGPTRGQAEAALLAEAKAPTAGYVFYTPADARALLAGTLDLWWGVSEDAAEGAAEVLAGKLVSTLAEAGFAVQWSGEPDAPIQLRGLDWKHPRERDTMDTALATRLASPSLPHLITDDGKWLFRIIVVAHDHGAHAMLWHIHERANPATLRPSSLGEFTHDGDYSLVFVPADLELGGRGVQFHLIAPPSRPWEAQTDAIGLGHALVLVPSHPFSLAEMRTRIHIMRGGSPPATTIVLDRWEAGDAAEVNPATASPCARSISRAATA